MSTDAMTTPTSKPTNTPTNTPTSMPMTKALLPESELPTAWYNIVADLPEPMPPHLHPGTKEPITAADLTAIFPPALAEQELSTQRYIDIPDEVRRIYAIWRPTPLIRAYRLEQALGTTARLYYKYEGVSPIGSHKANSSVAQAYFNHIAGVKRLTTELRAASTSLSAGCASASSAIWRVTWSIASS